jgi:hypothetical protein
MVAPPELVRIPELIRVLLWIEAEVIEPTHATSPFPSPSEEFFPPQSNAGCRDSSIPGVS